MTSGNTGPAFDRPSKWYVKAADLRELLSANSICPWKCRDMGEMVQYAEAFPIG